MRSLFYKVFLWFWVLMIIIGGLLGFSSFWATVKEDRWRTQALNLLGETAPKAAQIFESSGENGLKTYLVGLERDRHIVTYFLDGDADHSQDFSVPGPVRERADLVRRNPLVPVATFGFAAQQVVGRSGHKYILVIYSRRRNSTESPVLNALMYFNQSLILRTTAVLLIGGVFCLWLARHITRPVVQLRSAVGRFADGHLDVRVGRVLGRRADEIGQLGRDFDRMTERIETLIKAQNDLLGDVSHELRSPLARLTVALELVRQRPANETGEYLDRIQAESARLDGMIGQLLTLARIESRVDEGSRESFDLAGLIQEIAVDGEFEAKAYQKSVIILSEEPCQVFGIQEMLRSAIENVVRNAIRFTQQGTVVEISLKRSAGLKLRSAILRVRDHGPGIPEALLPSIFHPFRRVPASSGEEQQGAGLGLAITDRVIRMHGGTVHACNAVDGGLFVQIELPLSEAKY